MNRDGYRLTEEAELEHSDFLAAYGRFGCCSCHLHPPCGWCSHPGNPENLDEDDSAWEREGVPRYVLPDDVPPPAGMTRDEFAAWSRSVCGMVFLHDNDMTEVTT